MVVAAGFTANKSSLSPNKSSDAPNNEGGFLGAGVLSSVFLSLTTGALFSLDVFCVVAAGTANKSSSLSSSNRSVDDGT